MFARIRALAGRGPAARRGSAEEREAFTARIHDELVLDLPDEDLDEDLDDTLDRYRPGSRPAEEEAEFLGLVEEAGDRIARER